MDNFDPGTVRSYRPGDWFGIFGTRATVVLPPSEKARVAGIWDLAVDGAGFDLLLDTLISGGLRDLASFVLVAADDEVTKVVVRGAAAAILVTEDETVRLDGEGATTWVDRTLRGVSQLTILVGAAAEGDGGADGDDAPELAVDRGLVRVSRVDQPRRSEQAEPPPAAQPAEQPVEEAVEEAAEEVGPENPDDTTDHDGLTRAGVADDPELLTQGIPGPSAAPERSAEPVATLTFSHGEVVAVDQVVLVGRAPVPQRSSGEDPRLVRVPSPQQEISSTHLEIRPGTGPDHGSAVVVDLGSTNGTVVVQPGLGPEDLRPGVAVQLLPGALVDLGDGLTIRVDTP